MVKLPVYMDNHATTPLDPRVLDAMMPYLTEHFGNASSLSHVFGMEASRAVDRGREQVAGRRGRHIITTSIEHRAVFEACAFLETQGFRVTRLPVDQHALLDPDDVRR